MSSPPLRFEHPDGKRKVGERQKEGARETAAREAGAAISHLIRMRHIFTTKSYENEFI